MQTTSSSMDIFISSLSHFYITIISSLSTRGRNQVPVEATKRPSTYWFFLNRYFSFSMNIIVTLFEFTTLDPKFPEQYNLARQLLLVVNQVLVSVLMTLRIYALYGCSFRVIGTLAATGAVLIGVSCWALFGQKSAPAPQSELVTHPSNNRCSSIRLAAAWEALFVYDSIIFALTLVKTWREGRNVAIDKRLPVITLFLRDGAIYFAVMALANLANILTFYFCGPFLRGGLSTFSSSISVTMMSRFMLNLHETASIGIFSTHITTQDYLSRLEFLGGLVESEASKNGLDEEQGGE
ncbi:hypothetical protein BD779DRAFT_1671403 [Infundibulicybe gibba]|nr:hypothetical protein BD779DRAFT_1671403 [Infundibulicybe gibba]